MRAEVYDAIGRRVTVLENRYESAGRGLLRWDGKGSSGADLPSGLYFIRIQMGGRGLTRPVVLVR
jgi:hypothetical protein